MDVAVEQGVAVVSLRDEGDRVVAVLESSAGTEEVTAGWVLGADGAGSVVRHATGLRLEGWEDGKYAVYADVDVEMDFPFDSTAMVTDARGQRSVRPMGGKRVRLAFPARQLDLSVVPTVDDVQALCDEMLNGRVRIVTPHWLLHYRAHRGLAPRFRVGRMLLAGDAGHVHPPAGGQGMNTGIQDAISAAWRLALITRGLAAPELLDDYNTERHAVATEMVNGTSKLATLMSGTGVTAVVRQAVLFALGHVHALNDVVATRAAQIAIDYHSAGTVIGPEGKAGTHVGEHLTDGPVAISDVVGPGHRVFAFGANAEERAALAALLGEIGEVREGDRYWRRPSGSASGGSSPSVRTGTSASSRIPPTTPHCTTTSVVACTVPPRARFHSAPQAGSSTSARPLRGAGGIGKSSRCGGRSPWRWTIRHSPSSRRKTCVVRSVYVARPPPGVSTVLCSNATV